MTKKQPIETVARPGLRVLHARYGQGQIRTIIAGHLEIDFDDGLRRYVRDSGYIKLNPGPDEGPDPNLLDFPITGISKKARSIVKEKKERQKMTEVVEKKKAKTADPLVDAKKAIREELKKKGNKELRSLCAQHGIQYNKYSKLSDSLKRMNVINSLTARIAKTVL